MTLTPLARLTSKLLLLLALSPLPSEAQTPPILTTQPLGQTTGVGSNVTFSVTATGTAPLGYQWLFNGSPIADATNTTHTLANLQQSHAGSYSVVVTNVGGSITSSLAIVEIRLPGPVFAWGSNDFGQASVPAGLEQAIAVAAGFQHSLALKSNGTVMAWGNNAYGEALVPAGINEVVGIAAGGRHSLAVRSDGSVLAWGANTHGQISVPVGLTGVAKVAAGGHHSVALKSDGSVVAWGRNDRGQCTVPTNLSRIISIAAGWYHTVALRDDGAVVAWGDNGNGQTTVPSGLLRAKKIAAGYAHTVAVREDGNVVAWGSGDRGQVSVPPSISAVLDITAGYAHTAAIKADGYLATWGNNAAGLSPSQSSVDRFAAISAGGYHNLAIAYVEVLKSSITAGPLSQNLGVGSNVTFSVTATGTAPLSYQWRHNGTPISGATTETLALTNVNRANAGSYAVVVTNAGGSVTSSPALLRVLVPQRLLTPERLGDGRFRLRFGDFDGGLAGAGELGAFEVYATTNVFNTNSWARLTNGLSIVNGQVEIEDTGAPGLARRFYRIMER